jgi:uncharacterized membrane-anchored protein
MSNQNVVHRISRLLIKIKKEENTSSRMIEERVSDILFEFKRDLKAEIFKEMRNIINIENKLKSTTGRIAPGFRGDNDKS